VESGEVVAKDSSNKVVFTYKANDYFGEVPVLKRGKK